MKKEVDLFLVERKNLDKKKYKVVHPFDGRLIPLYPSVLKKYSARLIKKLNLQGVKYIVGFAEGGVLSAYGVASITGIPLVCSYRVRLKAKGEIRFEEPHSMRPGHFIYPLQRGDKIVIIEDEITTGSTLASAVKKFSKNGIKIVDVGSFILASARKKNKSLEDAERILGIKIKYLFDESHISGIAY